MIDDFDGDLVIVRLLLLLDENVLPPHLHAPAGVNLQADEALRELGRWIGVIRHLHAVKMRYDAIALHRHFKIIPLARLQGLLTFRGGHNHPTAAAAFIQAAGVLAGVGVHLDLHSNDVRTVLRINAGNSGMQEHAAVPCRLTLELQAQIEIAIDFFRGQIAVLVGCALAQNGAVFCHPLFTPILLPAGQILSVEQRHPTLFRRRLRYCAERTEQPKHQKRIHSPHRKPQKSMTHCESNEKRWPHSAFRFEPPRDDSRAAAYQQSIQMSCGLPWMSAVSGSKRQYNRAIGPVAVQKRRSGKLGGNGPSPIRDVGKIAIAAALPKNPSYPLPANS